MGQGQEIIARKLMVRGASVDAVGVFGGPQSLAEASRHAPFGDIASHSPTRLRMCARSSPQCLSASNAAAFLPPCLPTLQATAAVEGQWVLLQNTHLGLGYLAEVEGWLIKAEDLHEDFRCGFAAAGGHNVGCVLEGSGWGAGEGVSVHTCVTHSTVYVNLAGSGSRRSRIRSSPLDCCRWASRSPTRPPWA